MKLNLGAGSKVIPGYINVDRAKLPTIDEVFDIDQAWCAWPWEPGSVDAIEAAHIFEHLHEPVHFMVQAHRVLKPGGRLHILTPHMSSMDSWTDPTHVRHCTEDSFAFWINDGNVHYLANNAAYGAVGYDLGELAVRGGVIDITLIKPAE